MWSSPFFLPLIKIQGAPHPHLQIENKISFHARDFSLTLRVSHFFFKSPLLPPFYGAAKPDLTPRRDDIGPLESYSSGYAECKHTKLFVQPHNLMLYVSSPWIGISLSH